MSFELTELDKNIIREIQKGLPLCTNPYEVIGKNAGVTKEKLLERLKLYKENKIIRRFGARLNHRKSGYRENIMTVWKVPEEKVEETGNFIAQYKQVSHCYVRPELENFPYNLYSMIHGQKEGECLEVIQDISDKTGITEYEMLITTEEYKKTAPLYFIE